MSKGHTCANISSRITVLILISLCLGSLSCDPRWLRVKIRWCASALYMSLPHPCWFMVRCQLCDFLYTWNLTCWRKHWGIDKMAGTLQTEFLNTFSRIKMLEFLFDFLFGRKGPLNNKPACSAPIHYINQWLNSLMTNIFLIWPPYPSCWFRSSELRHILF